MLMKLIVLAFIINDYSVCSFLIDLETLLGVNVMISHIGDLVLKHCSTFQAHYVPYVTNMNYQEALVSRLL